MGLDITAYSQLVESGDYREDGDYDYHVQAHIYLNPDFPMRCIEFSEAKLYSFANEFTFDAGSYSSYRAWRDWLARLVGHGSAQDAWTEPKPGAFIEVIDFSDCEGAIGTTVSKKLAADFAEYRGKAEAQGKGNDGWYWQQYQRWQTAFELASDRGAVVFH
jgi:hypothetical protein